MAAFLHRIGNFDKIKLLLGENHGKRNYQVMKRVVAPEEIWDKIMHNRQKEVNVGLFTFIFGIMIYFPVITKRLCNPYAV